MLTLTRESFDLSAATTYYAKKEFCIFLSSNSLTTCKTSWTYDCDCITNMNFLQQTSSFIALLCFLLVKESNSLPCFRGETKQYINEPNGSVQHISTRVIPAALIFASEPPSKALTLSSNALKTTTYLQPPTNQHKPLTWQKMANTFCCFSDQKPTYNRDTNTLWHSTDFFTTSLVLSTTSTKQLKPSTSLLRPANSTWQLLDSG